MLYSWCCPRGHRVGEDRSACTREAVAHLVRLAVSPRRQEMAEQKGVPEAMPLFGRTSKPIEFGCSFDFEIVAVRRVIAEVGPRPVPLA